MICHFKMSMIGTSHQKLPNGVCQDYSEVIELKNGWMAAAIADGLGSAARSEQGAAAAVRSSLDFIATNISDVWEPKALCYVIKQSFERAMDNIKQKAQADNRAINDYDTTLSVVIYDGSRMVYGHSGDGGIIGMGPDGSFFLLTKVQKGEACNETYPLRSGVSHWSFGRSTKEVCALALMTDGLFDLACPAKLVKFSPSQPIYINYIRRFLDINISGAKTAEDFLQLEKKVREYFSGEGKEDTTDDKTIVALVNTDITPKVKEADYYKLPDLDKIMASEQTGLYPGLAGKAQNSPPPRQPQPDVCSPPSDSSDTEILPITMEMQRYKSVQQQASRPAAVW